jgi:hypothetical protein
VFHRDAARTLKQGLGARGTALAWGPPGGDPMFVLGQEVPRLFGFTVSLARHWPWLLAAMCAPPAIAAASARRHPRPA